MDIFKAVKTGDLKAVADYLKAGGDVNARDFYNMTPLIAAVDEEHADIVMLLIKSRADVNAKDKMGQTALYLAAGRNNAEIVKLLIEAKADLNVKAVNGLTPYRTAAENGLDKAALLLKKAGAR